MSVELPAPDPDWKVALRAVHLALSLPQAVPNLGDLVNWLFGAAQHEVEVCIATLLDIEDVTNDNIASELADRWRELFKEIHQLARRDLPRVCDRIVDGNHLDAALIQLRTIGQASLPALTFLNGFLASPTTARQNVAITKAEELSRALAGWNSKQ